MTVRLEPSRFEDLLKNNENWRDGITDVDPTFFVRYANKQEPSTFWIGCSDSRVAASVITGSVPGSIFTHSNIANLVHPDDVNLLSILQYAVETLHVQHVVVVGHTNCGGVKASLHRINSTDAKPVPSPIGRWLSPLIALADYLGLRGPNVVDPVNTLMVESVKLQVSNLVNTETIRKAWYPEDSTLPIPRGPLVHGWVYDVGTGLLKDLNITRGGEDEISAKDN